MSREKPRELYALRYMTRFQCIAERCEDTCCAMLLTVDAREMNQLETTVGATEAGKAVLEANVERREDLPYGAVAMVRRRADNTCLFLDPDKLCSIIKAHGFPPIPDACHEYPRFFISYPGGRVDVVGRLGCPEAARLCLLADDGLDLVPAEAGISFQYPVVPDGLRLNAYAQPIAEVRDWAVARLRDTRYPTGARLLSMAALGARVDSWFYRGVQEVDYEALRAAMRAVEAPEEMERIAHAIPASGSPLLFKALSSTLQAKCAADGSPRCAAVALPLLASYQAAAEAPAVAQASGGDLWAGVARVFDQRRAGLSPAVAAKVDRIVERYAIYDWHRAPYPLSGTLSETASLRLLRAAIIRFMLLGNPMVWNAPADAKATSLDDALVETVQVFSRYLERDPGVYSGVDAIFTPEALGTDAWGRLCALAQAA
ncbi:MAG TPA: flagellin lysine-N-methylase [Myxococcales bacterium]|nr:flagellin lysine-N-methylase [Myxococcales bacterium]